MKLDHIVAVLCRPADSRNVGGAIRAVVNHGLAELRVVTDTPFDPEDLFFFSSGSVDVAEYREFPTLDAAIADRSRVIGTSRRRRDDDGPPVWPAAGLRDRIGSQPTAILFGTERTGLTTEELDRCEAAVEVPTTERYPSMNLAHAVAVIGYELARPEAARVGPSPEPVGERVPAAAREALFAKIEAVAEGLSYPPGRSPQAFVRRLRRILDRANPDHEELSLIAGIFSEMGRLGGVDR